MVIKKSPDIVMVVTDQRSKCTEKEKKCLEKKGLINYQNVANA